MMNNNNSCCSKPAPAPAPLPSCCGGGGGDDGHEHGGKKRIDWIMMIGVPLIVIPYALYLFAPGFIESYDWLSTYTHSVHEFVHATWWGVLLGIFFLALMSKVPREFVMSALGNKKGAKSIGRAVIAGVLLDMCNHGILMIATKIYKRGASAGQFIAFLVASPWNSFSLTLILIGLIGLELTLIFIVLSMIIAFISGMAFDWLVGKKVLPENPNAFDMPEDFRFVPEAKRQFAQIKWTPAFVGGMFKEGVMDSAIVVRWLVFGIVAASLLRVFVSPEDFAQYFGATLLGLMATLFFATVLEVCSEGSAPIATDIINRGMAPGNGFAFLMAGASTDYTEIMIIRDTAKSWKMALFLPLITLPQIVILAILLNLAA